MWAVIEILVDTWPEFVLILVAAFGLVFLAKWLPGRHTINIKDETERKDDGPGKA